jgi:glycosyltransferase involved in cell wall biosynthesis
MEWSRLGYVMAVFRAQFAPAAAHFWRFILDMPRKPDVVHCNDLDTLLVGVLAKKRYGCRLVYDAHEYYPHSDPYGGWMDRTLFHALEKVLARQADAVITVNHQLAYVIQKAYGLRRVGSVPNAEPWSDVEIRPVSSSMTALAAGRVRFLFQGRFSPGRGIEEVITAWSKVDASLAALFIRGPDNPWRADLLKQAQQLGILERSVYFLDAVGEDDLVSAAAEADVGLIPYKGDVAGYKYACPNKLSQYLHAGLMVVSNDLPYVREVIEEADAGLCYSCENPDSLVEVVHRIAGDRDLLARSKGNARRYARDKFNWQAFSETLYGAYSAGHRVIRGS